MRTRMVVTLAAALSALAGCGSGGTFANKPRPATPVNLSVYVDNARVSVSPARTGAGPVVFIVTNQSNRAESITINPSGNSAQSLATAGPINPQSTAQVTVDISRPGDYTVATGKGSGTEAALATQSGVKPATIHIGQPRPTSSNQLLQP